MAHSILVVDDIADIRTFVHDTLAPEGYTIIEATNGREALELFKKHSPTLVLLDISIGQPDGFEVCREIRKLSSAPIVMLTSHVQEMDEAICEYKRRFAISVMCQQFQRALFLQAHLR
jgi:CheY-like chemotaxis protein